MTKTKQKFSLTVNPTFKASVDIQVPGGQSVALLFTFKHRTRDEFKEFTELLRDAELDGADEIKDTDILLDIASGWELDEPFDRESLEKMVQRYMGSAQSVIRTYIDELTGARVKN